MKILALFSLLLVLSACSDSENNNISGSGEVSYKITLNTTWSSATHPEGFPGNPHFSTLVGATHNINTIYWETGNIASAGIEQMAETGGTSALIDEINGNISIGDSDVSLLSDGINASPGSTSFTLPVNSTHSYLSLVTMLAPSPDWFIGVSGYNLMPNGIWLENETVTLFAYDAGSDSGSNYNSPNADTNPKQAISQITGNPFLVNGVVVPVGELVIERLQ